MTRDEKIIRNTGDTTLVFVHRWCRPGRTQRKTSITLADA